MCCVSRTQALAEAVCGRTTGQTGFKILISISEPVTSAVRFQNLKGHQNVCTFGSAEIANWRVGRSGHTGRLARNAANMGKSHFLSRSWCQT